MPICHIEHENQKNGEKSVLVRVKDGIWFIQF